MFLFVLWVLSVARFDRANVALNYCCDVREHLTNIRSVVDRPSAAPLAGERFLIDGELARPVPLLVPLQIRNRDTGQSRIVDFL